METIKSTQSVGEIVTILPKASEIFKKYKIDFCCGGHKALIDVMKEQQLNEGEILGKLAEAFEEQKKISADGRDFRKMSPGELTEYIENTHHVYVKRALPEISELTTKIMRVHGANHESLFKVHKIFATIRTEMEQHLMKEEEILFPAIREYDRNPSDKTYEKIKKVMKETEDEHEAVGALIKELRHITDEYMVPADGCGTYCYTFEKLVEFEADLFQHIHLENNILFRKLDLDIH